MQRRLYDPLRSSLGRGIVSGIGIRIIDDVVKRKNEFEFRDVDLKKVKKVVAYMEQKSWLERKYRLKIYVTSLLGIINKGDAWHWRFRKSEKI